jgi:glycosyltransferase involved in cell wall biosynthesis
VLERVQVVAAAPALARSVDLVHAVFTIGPGFRALSRAKRLIAAGRPVIHTVPGIADVRHLVGVEPLGLTVALTMSTADQLREAGFPDVRVIPPVIPLDLWPSRPRSSAPLPTVVFAGHYDRGGGHVEAIRAAAEAARAGARFRLVLAMRTRPGEKAAKLAESALGFARDLGLTDVRVYGRVEDMAAMMAEADVVVFPPTGLAGGKADVPITVLEALATCRPVIVSDLPQFATLGDAVLRAPVDDPRATAALLRSVLADDDLWHRSARRGRQLVERSFAPERMAQSYAALYQEVLGSTRGLQLRRS